MKRRLILTVALVLSVVAPAAAVAADEVPVFAHYYIWFDKTSWNRAKIDYPTLGRYSSDNEAVMRQHVRWARDAGIDGFLVSWKSTPTLNRRLAALTRISQEEGFRLGIVYQGLDFERNPQPIDAVKRDFELFADQFATQTPYGVFDKPLVIWSGTWRFTPGQIAHATEKVRDRLYILASEKQVADYVRVADMFDGNMYYWSSIDPETAGRGYEDKLLQMSAAVHARNGIWIAPAAPGFDARKVGGTSVVERRDGQTLRDELAVAQRSSPDLIGIISWNEFSENTHIEPSETYGSTGLEVVADTLGAKAPAVNGDFNSSDESPPSPTSIAYGIPLLVGFVAFLFLGVGLARRRRVVGNVPPTSEKHVEHAP